jgi:hypothetical protein
MINKDQLTAQQKTDALSKLHSLAQNVYDINAQGASQEDLMMVTTDLQVIKIFLSIYSIVLGGQNFAFDLIDTMKMVLYWHSFYELKDNNKRNDEGIADNVAVVLIYYYFIFNHTDFTLSNEFLFQALECTKQQLYNYNTENEDGNKTEYEDLPQLEKIYTDNIMNNISTLQTLQKSISSSIAQPSDISETNSTDLLNYLQETTNILTQCFPELLEHSVEQMFTTIQTYTGFYVENYLDSDAESLVDMDYKRKFINFFSDELFHDFTVAIAEPGIYFLTSE